MGQEELGVRCVLGALNGFFHCFVLAYGHPLNSLFQWLPELSALCEHLLLCQREVTYGSPGHGAQTLLLLLHITPKFYLRRARAYLCVAHSQPNFSLDVDI